ncbi:MAG: recombinase RecA [Candidatus Lokiarchaeota archaeon]|nr:recombinase RecA [Candidatus Lokiarchaeota archaeon]
MAKKQKTESDSVVNINGIDDLKKECVKRWGDAVLMEMGNFSMRGIDAISTGSLCIDEATGVGGIPKGRIIEIFGPEGSGKTMLSLHCVANVQRNDGVAAFIDAEHALDPKFATDIGVDLDHLLLSQPDYGEQALEMVELMVRSQVVDIIVIDSVAALTPKKEIEGEMGESHIGAQARMMSQAMRKIAGIIKKRNVAVIFINQLRMKVGVMMGTPETTPGGKALKFYAGMRIDIRRVQGIKDGDIDVGHRASIKIAKNKVAAPFRKCFVPIIYGEGISKAREIIDLGFKYKLVGKSGSWFSYGDTRIGNGIVQASAFLKENPDIMDELYNQIRSIMIDNDNAGDTDESSQVQSQ